MSDIAPIDIATLRILEDPEPKRRPTNGHTRGAAIPEGSRNDSLYRRAVGAWKSGKSREDVLQATREANEQCDPPLDDEEVARIVDSATKAERIVRQAKRWDVLHIGDADGANAADYVVDEVLHAGTGNMLFGASGTLKTQVALDFAAHIGLGEPWHGRKTKRGASIVVCAEGGGGIEARLHAVRLEFADLPRHSIAVVRGAVQLLDASECQDFAEQIVTELLPEMPAPVLLIVFDTYSQSTVGGAGEEEAFQIAERNVRELVARVTEAQDGRAPAGLLVHHSGKDPSRGARGSSAMGCNLDAMIEAEADSDDRSTPLDQRTFRLHLRKVKDGPDGIEIPYGAALRHVATRDDGKPIFAPVVRELDASEKAAARKAKPYTPKPGTWPARVLDAMVDLRARDGGKTVPEAAVEASGYRAQRKTAPPPHRVQGLSRNCLIEFLDAKYAHAGAAVGQSADTVDANHRRQRDRALSTLEERGIVRVYDGWIWLEAQ